MTFNKYQALTFLLTLSACSEQLPLNTDPGAEASGDTPLRLITLIEANLEQCPAGGSVLLTYSDINRNGIYDSSDKIHSENKICNGIQGVGTGIEVVAAPQASCPAGGAVFKTFLDANNNTLRELGETITSSTTLCNGRDGSDGVNGEDGDEGASARITTSLASSEQCPNGGTVYRSAVGDSEDDVNVICNGEDSAYSMGAVGDSVTGKSYSACHHDYLYLPDSQSDDRGWLLFRHQSNGAADQGIGSTGFQVWNVDITNFGLASEVGNVTYCQLSWNPLTRLLNYLVTDTSDGHQGESGSIQL